MVGGKVNPIIGTLSSYDGNGRENITKNMNLRLFKLYRVYLEPLYSSKWASFPGVEFLRAISMFKSSIKRRMGRFHVVVVQWTSKKCT